MCKFRLLLNDMLVFHKNLLKIRCGRVISGNKRLNFFRLFLFAAKSFCSVGELNFSQDFTNERCGIASLTESKSRLYLLKFSLTELVIKRRNASPLIKPFFVLKRWQDEKCVFSRLEVGL